MGNGNERGGGVPSNLYTRTEPKFFNVIKQDQATIMVTKTSDSDSDNVKVFVFDVIMYLLDGLIDKELSDSSLEKMKVGPDFKTSVDGKLSCKRLWENFQNADRTSVCN